jgi:hypothetical protein
MAVMLACWRAELRNTLTPGLRITPRLGARYAGVFVKALFGRDSIIAVQRKYR